MWEAEDFVLLIPDQIFLSLRIKKGFSYYARASNSPESEKIFLFLFTLLIVISVIPF